VSVYFRNRELLVLLVRMIVIRFLQYNSK
jgi:hypothetical protein